LDSKFRNGLHQRNHGNGPDVLIGVISAVHDIAVLIRSRAVDRGVKRHRAAIALLVVVDVVRESAKLAGDGAGADGDQRNDVAAEQGKLFQEFGPDQVSFRRIVGL